MELYTMENLITFLLYFIILKSLESYSGRFLRDTMHGVGEYRWRYKGPNGIFLTYEGHFYGNNFHGYGQMSYPDGRLFKVSNLKNVKLIYIKYR